MSAPERRAALATAVAVATLAGIDQAPAPVSVEEVLGDRDPLEVLAALGTAWSVTLGVLLGADGRRDALAQIGLRAAQQQPGDGR